MNRITLIQPRSPSAEMYVNPLELQRLAGYLEDNLVHLAEVRLFDLNVEGAEALLRSHELQSADIICVATPAGSFNAVGEILRISSVADKTIVFIGETVTDGLTEAYLRSFSDTGVRGYAFVGRAEEDFLDLIIRLLEGVPVDQSVQSVQWIDSGGRYWRGKDSILEKEAVGGRPLFTRDIISEIDHRGLFVLLDGLTRGCEHRCNYCRLNSARQTSGLVQNVSRGTVETVLSLSQELRRRIYIQFTDENFFGGRTLEQRRVRLMAIRDFADSLKKAGYLGMIGVDTRADTVVDVDEDHELAKLRSAVWSDFASSGLGYAYLGVESLSKEQLKRYSKSLNLSSVKRAIDFLEGVGVSYTIGLIVLDPLVSVDELSTTISFIEDYKLFGNVASLFKEMRVSNRSPYYKLLEQKGLAPTGCPADFLYFEKEDLRYSDPVVARGVSVTRRIHRLFGGSGYRHSDLAAMRAFARCDKTVPFDGVPGVIGKMEVDIWKYLLANDLVDNRARLSHVSDICRNALDEVRRLLEVDIKDEQKVYPHLGVIGDYYRRVFHRVEGLVSAGFLTN